MKPEEQEVRYGPWIDTSGHEKFQVIDRPPMCQVNKVMKVRRNFTADTLEVRTIRFEDTIRPVPLKFDPPLQECGDNKTAFLYHWERMTFLFDLENPAKFPQIELLPDERRIIERFVSTARNLASYSAINFRGGSTLSSRKGEWSVKSNFPSHESFAGTSATFRQLHNDTEHASFIAARRELNTAIERLDSDVVTELRPVVKTWSKARASLMRTMASTQICEKLKPGQPDDAPRSLKGVVPEELIKTYNYGESLHWGDQKDAVADLENDIYNENFHKRCCIQAMLSLSHLYFGFAVLLEAALGVDQP
ncbi:hypothetical protein [Rhodococcus qingshengii]|uniref:hypothetical protein n=1 Tax=Rhodococcus qingshengii TaxID=334542 RepID=UPI0027DEBD21|nr:hypothetical protein [Rhodococcus qingshengii]